MKLDDYLESHRAAVVDEAVLALERWRLTHYAADGGEATRARLDRLLRILAEAARTRSSAGMQAHAERLATERFQAGYDLREVQTAFNVLEEILWGRLLRDASPEEMPRALGLVATVLGYGKDALARGYVTLAAGGRVPSLDLSALSRGLGAGSAGPEI